MSLNGVEEGVECVKSADGSRSCAKLSYADAQGVVGGKGLGPAKVTNAQDVRGVEDDLKLLRVSTCLAV